MPENRGAALEASHGCSFPAGAPPPPPTSSPPNRRHELLGGRHLHLSVQDGPSSHKLRHTAFRLGFIPSDTPLKLPPTMEPASPPDPPDPLNLLEAESSELPFPTLSPVSLAVMSFSITVWAALTVSIQSRFVGVTARVGLSLPLSTRPSSDARGQHLLVGLDIGFRQAVVSGSPCFAGGDWVFPLPQLKSDFLVLSFAPVNPVKTLPFPTVPKPLVSIGDEQKRDGPHLVCGLLGPSASHIAGPSSWPIFEFDLWGQSKVLLLLLVSIPIHESLACINCLIEGHLSKYEVFAFLVLIRAASQIAFEEIKNFSIEFESLHLDRDIFSGSCATNLWVSRTSQASPEA